LYDEKRWRKKLLELGVEKRWILGYFALSNLAGFRRMDSIIIIYFWTPMEWKNTTAFGDISKINITSLLKASEILLVLRQLAVELHLTCL
jgi:hypothetical protein